MPPEAPTTIDTFIGNLAPPDVCVVCGAAPARTLSVRATRVRFTVLFYTSFDYASVPVRYCRRHARRVMAAYALGMTVLFAALATAVVGTIRLYMDDHLIAGTAALVALVPTARWLERLVHRVTRPVAIHLSKNGAARVRFATPEIAARWRARGRF